MTLLRLESFDRISTSTAAAKGIIMDTSAGGGTPYNTIAPTGGRRGGGAYKSRANAYPALLQLHPGSDVIYVGVAVNFPAGLGNNAFIQLKEKYGIGQHLNIHLTTAGAVGVKRGTTALAVTADGVVTDGVWYYVEVYAKISDTAGEVQVRLDGTPIIDLDGSPVVDTRDGNEGIIDCVYLATPATLADAYFDDLYICDDAGSRNNGFLGDIRVDCYAPTADGTHSGMTGTGSPSGANYTLVDDGSGHDSDSTYVAGTADSPLPLETYDVGGMDHDPADIFGVQVTAIAKRSDVGARQLRLMCRSGGTDYEGEQRHALMQAYTGESEMWEADPAGPSPEAWTQTAFNTTEFGVKVAG